MCDDDYDDPTAPYGRCEKDRPSQPDQVCLAPLTRFGYCRNHDGRNRR